jgi:hypothetical protein
MVILSNQVTREVTRNISRSQTKLMSWSCTSQIELIHTVYPKSTCVVSPKIQLLPRVSPYIRTILTGTIKYRDVDGGSTSLKENFNT